MPGEQEFEAVLRAYQNKVFRLCCAMIGNRALAEETAQEVFLRVWKGLPGYRGQSSLSTWIYSITRNTCLTSMKKKAERRDFSLEIPSVRHAAEQTAADPRKPDRQLDILRLVSELPAHYRQVILLYHMEEKSYEEVATMLDLPLGTVKTSPSCPTATRRGTGRSEYPFNGGEWSMSDRERAFRMIDEELDAALAHITAPPDFAANVLRRARGPSLTRLPEILDLIGFIGVLAVVFVLLIWFAPDLDNTYWAATLGAAIVVTAFCFGLRSIRELGE